MPHQDHLGLGFHRDVEAILRPIVHERIEVKCVGDPAARALDDEHAWIFSKKFLESYLKEIFTEVKFARWIVGHEILILKK